MTLFYHCHGLQQASRFLAMDMQTSSTEAAAKGLEKSQSSQNSQEKEWLQIPKPQGEKCHDGSRLDKIIDNWRESKGLGTKPVRRTRQAAASSSEWSRRFGMLDQLAQRQAALQQKIDSRQDMGPERRPVKGSGRLETRPTQIAQASEPVQRLETKPEQDEAAVTPIRPEADVAAACQDSWCGVS